MSVSVHFSHSCSAANEPDLFSSSILKMENDMADEHRVWPRQAADFWRTHHEAWKRSDLNQRQYCEAEGTLKAFGNWRAQLKAEPQPPERKLLYRRRMARRYGFDRRVLRR
jgi:hypothetical protein